MKIGYICAYDDLGCGESEARIRWTYLAEKKGHTVVPLNKHCRTFDTDEHADNLGLDLVVTAQVIEQTDIVYPDVESCFFFWAPASFFSDSLRNDYLRYMGKYDLIVGGYESKNPIAALSLSPYFHYNELLPLMASVPIDFVIPCEEKQNLKLFYVGMGERYKKLLTKLENKNLIDIYGPKKVFNKSPWIGFKSYKGTIPYDGKTIIQTMHDTGIVLALHSKSHNREDFVSNRIFEAAAAGAIIITDDNKFIRKYFGDSVYYLDIFKSSEEQEKDLFCILDEIFNHKDEAFKKAQRAQKIFIEKLSLDHQIDAFLEFIENEKNKKNETSDKKVDCVCLIDNENDFYHIQDELKKQYFGNLHLVIAATQNILEKIKENILFEYSFCLTDDATFSKEIASTLTGDFFIILDKNSVLHRNHIFKAVQILSQNKYDFAYSGCYEKIMKGNAVSDYKTINFRPYDFHSLFSDFREGNNDGVNIWQFLTLYPKCCFIFNRAIITSDYEMHNIPVFVAHLYLCLKSLFSDKGKNAFIHTISAGKIPSEIPEKTFFYDHLGNVKDEILEKIKTNLCWLIDNTLTDTESFVLDDINRDVFKMLLRYIQIKKMFSIQKKRKKELSQKIKKIKTLLKKGC